MTCDQAEELLFESFDDELGVEARRALDRHLGTCRHCSALSVRLRSVDARLTGALPAVLAPRSIAEGVRREQRRERFSALREGLPDLMHLAGCSGATAVSALLLPVEAITTVSVGVAFTCFTYLVMAVVRSTLEAAEQPEW
jgi:anti-sigma factor RsiW